jgi:WD40 repeat protein
MKVIAQIAFLFLCLGVQDIAASDEPLSIIVDLDWKPDSTQLAVGYQDELNARVIILDSNEQILQSFLFEDEKMSEVYWRPPDGEELLILTAQSLHLINLQTQTDRLVHPRGGGTIAFNADGSLIARSAFGNGAPVYVSDLDTVDSVVRFGGQQGQYMGPIAWNPVDKNVLAVGMYSGVLTVLNVSSGEVIHSWSDPLELNIRLLSWSHDGSKLAVDGDIWDTANWTVLVFTGLDTAISWQPDGQYIASVDEKVFKLINTEDGTILDIQFMENDLYDVAWSPDGSKIAYGGVGNFLEIVNYVDMLPTPSPMASGQE